MCVIQIYSDIEDCGEFESLDEDIWLESDGSFLLILHMLVKIKKDLPKFNIILHGKLLNPKNSTFYSESWNIIDDKIIAFNNTFLNEQIRENYYENGYEILNHNTVKIEGVTAIIDSENNVSTRACDTNLKECTCVEIDFKSILKKDNIYAMRLGFHLAPRSKIRHIVNKMKIQIHYYTTLHLKSDDSLIINNHTNKTIPINPNKSTVFMMPTANIEIERPSVPSTYNYEHSKEPLSETNLENPRIAYRWEVERIRKSTAPFVTDDSDPVSLTFSRFNTPHYISYFALFFAILGLISRSPGMKLSYYAVYMITFYVFFQLMNRTYPIKK